MWFYLLLRHKAKGTPQSQCQLTTCQWFVTFRFIYQFCENIKEKPDGEIQFETKSWCPVDLGLQDISHDLVTQVRKTSEIFMEPRELKSPRH